MAFGSGTGPIHPQRTERSGYRYEFYWKHHGRGSTGDSQWLPQMSHDEEFAVFNLADQHTLANRQGDLFGLWVGADREIQVLGTRGEQVAEFPVKRPDEVWHGYPLWPIENRDDEGRVRTVVPREALDKMLEVGLLTKSERRRLAGKHV